MRLFTLSDKRVVSFEIEFPQLTLPNSETSMTLNKPHRPPPLPSPSSLHLSGGASTATRHQQNSRAWSSRYHHRRPQLPHDVLAEIFTYLCESVALVFPRSLRQDAEDTEIAVGPLIQITRVCHFWREVAFSCPLLWSTIPILLESRKIQALANPGQVRYYLQRAPRTPLSLVIGTREHLVGPGVKAEEPLQGHTLDFLMALVPRIRNMAVAFPPDSDMLPIFSRCTGGFSNLANLAVVGVQQSPTLLELAGFWKHMRIRRVVWGISESHTVALPHFFTNPWAALTEVFMADDWNSAIPAAAVHAFFTAAKGLVAFRGRVCDCSPGEDPSLDLDLPMLQHENLRALFLTFQASLRHYSGTPSLLLSLRLPRLRLFSFNLHHTARFDPGAVTRWLCQDSSRCLTAFECLMGCIDSDDLLRCLQAMPLLETFKCKGVLLGSGQIGSSVIDAGRAVINQRFLKALATPTAYDVGVGQFVSPERLAEAETMPCPLLREIHFTNAYLGQPHIDAFLKARLYGSQRFTSSECLEVVCLLKTLTG